MIAKSAVAEVGSSFSLTLFELWGITTEMGIYWSDLEIGWEGFKGNIPST